MFVLIIIAVLVVIILAAVGKTPKEAIDEISWYNYLYINMHYYHDNKISHPMDSK